MNTATRLRLAVDLAVCVAAVAAVSVTVRAVWHALAAAGRDVLATVARHQRHKDALARASAPRSVPR